MPEVTNELFESAWANEDNRRIIAKVCREYMGQIDREELTYRGYMALFNCLRKHNGDYTTKFTSSLHRHIVWECKKAIRNERKNPPLPSLPNDWEPYKVASSEVSDVRECLDMLDPGQASILRSYYFDSMTLQEIGDKAGCTRPAIMYHLRRAEEAFRRLYGHT